MLHTHPHPLTGELVVVEDHHQLPRPGTIVIRAGHTGNGHYCVHFWSWEQTGLVAADAIIGKNPYPPRSTEV